MNTVAVRYRPYCEVSRGLGSVRTADTARSPCIAGLDTARILPAFAVSWEHSGVSVLKWAGWDGVKDIGMLADDAS